MLDGTALSGEAEDASLLTTSDYLSVHASCQAANSPDSRLRWQSGGYFVKGTERCLISQVLAKGREGNAGIWGDENEAKACHGLHGLHSQQREACAVIIHPWAAFLLSLNFLYLAKREKP